MWWLLSCLNLQFPSHTIKLLYLAQTHNPYPHLFSHENKNSQSTISKFLFFYIVITNPPGHLIWLSFDLTQPEGIKLELHGARSLLATSWMRQTDMRRSNMKHLHVRKSSFSAPCRKQTQFLFLFTRSL